MVFFGSLGVFIWGILKRAYCWAPAILLDPFDIYNRFIRPNLPEGRQEELDLPPGLFPYVLVGGILRIDEF